MILKFPDLNTLRLALTTGVLPAAIVQASVVAGFDDSEQLWVEATGSLARGTLGELRKLNVISAKTMGCAVTAMFASWLELVPLLPDPRPPEKPDQLPVLFELNDGNDLARIVFEILRLGNDRQSFRWLANDDGDTRALLRVVGPPYYSLLRAIDRNGKTNAPVAYVERAPNIWVELGQTHPLLDLVKVPKGKLLFLRAPQRWTVLDNVPLRDIYEVMEFTLPDRAVEWRDQPLDDKIDIALSLRSGGPLSGAQMWVLRDDPEAELNRFVQNANEQLLTSLAFAVGEHDGRQTIVVRALYSKAAPPELVLNATPYRSHLRLANLLLPVGTQLHPHLRRDVVRKLLADDTEHVVWLVPGDGGSFTPQSLPENSFRPLTDWVAYVLDRSAEPLRGWMQAMRFDFEPFVCDEDADGKPKKPDEPKEKRPKGRKGRRDDGDEEIVSGPTIDYIDRTKKLEADVPEMEFAELLHIEPSVLQLQLRAAEERFLAVDGDLDAPERRQLWPELGNLHTGLKQTDDAGLCWLAALWFQDKIPLKWAQAYLQAEASAVRSRAELKLPPNRTWITGVTSGRPPELDALLSLEEPTPPDLRALAAYLVWAGAQPSAPPALLERLSGVQRFLEKHERLLPVRAIWLAWSALVHLAGGDVLALARTRDRLLERLFQGGLRPEYDLPGFLRFSGQPVSQRYRGMRQWMTQMCELAHMWAEENSRSGERRPNGLSAPMKGYIDLLFAFGLARLGEHDAARQLLQTAAAIFHEEEPVHVHLFKSFEFRIREALEGHTHAGPLPDEQYQEVQRLANSGRGGSVTYRYVIERLRCHLRALEPNQQIDPYRHQKALSDLDKALAAITDLTDRQELTARFETLWLGAPKGAKGEPVRATVLREALNLAPRVHEEFARKMLERALVTLDALPFPPPGDWELTEYVKLLEKALFVAAHFDRAEHVPPLVSRFKKVLQLSMGPEPLKAVAKTANNCFRGMRKMGMREETQELLDLLGDTILAGRDLTKLDAKTFADTPHQLLALLEVAAGWYCFGRGPQAEAVLRVARGLLLKEVLLHTSQTPLARSYVVALGQAPVESAQDRLIDLFTHLRGVRDSYGPNNYLISQSQLEVLESVILAVTHDDFTLGANARRWLEDDEYLVRQRIHHDVRTILGRE